MDVSLFFFIKKKTKTFQANPSLTLSFSYLKIKKRKKL